MLSVVDLIDAETITVAQAAVLTARVEAGDSVLVGASPGGAGKTAIMGALLTMLPPGESLHVTHTGNGFGLGERGRAKAWREAADGDCVVAYEISPASYEAYIWGGDLREFLERGLAGARLFANLHADTLEEARDQIVTDNGATLAAFDAFDVFVPITVAGGLGRRSRVVERIDYRHPGSSPRGGAAADAGGWSHVGRSPRLSRRAAEIAPFLENLADDDVRRIEDVRRRWLAFLGR
jgi:hypothetical protein